MGVHRTSDIDDGYMGSGKVIRSAIEKYGIDNFRKDILETFDTYDAALAKEAVIVNEEFLLRNDVYNLRRGGTGGFDYINKYVVVDRKTISENLWKDTAYRFKQSEIDRSNFGGSTFSGKVHSAETKTKISKACKGINAGYKKFSIWFCLDNRWNK